MFLKKRFLSTVFLSILVFPLFADNVVPAVSVSSGQPNAEDNTIPMAVDNSVVLLEAADSLARIDTRPRRENMLFLPVVFVSYEMIPDPKIERPAWIPFAREKAGLDYDRQWCDNLKWELDFERYHLNRIAIETPWLVPYNISMMPEPPKEYEVKLDVKKNILSIEERKLSVPTDAPETEVKQRNWIHAFDASLQFSQSYLSENWYQGGTKNLNMISNINYFLQLNKNLHPDLLYELSVQYKLGMNSAPDDELRDYSINEDLFQVNTKFGLKATKKFYYSMSLQFKTQLLQNFKTNTWDLAASFLTPGELNAGVGMTYSTKNEKGSFVFDASLSPLSYNMKICRAIHKADPTAYGIDAGKRLGHEVGSSGECKVTWNCMRNVTISSRIFAFSDYSYLQGDWETTIDFSINKFLSTRVYAHLRFDNSSEWNPDWKYWQFKEVFSLGLQYKFRI